MSVHPIFCKCLFVYLVLSSITFFNHLYLGVDFFNLYLRSFFKNDFGISTSTRSLFSFSRNLHVQKSILSTGGVSHALVDYKTTDRT